MEGKKKIQLSIILLPPAMWLWEMVLLRWCGKTNFPGSNPREWGLGLLICKPRFCLLACTALHGCSTCFHGDPESKAAPVEEGAMEGGIRDYGDTSTWKRQALEMGWEGCRV